MEHFIKVEKWGNLKAITNSIIAGYIYNMCNYQILVPVLVYLIPSYYIEMTFIFYSIRSCWKNTKYSVRKDWTQPLMVCDRVWIDVCKRIK